MSLKSRLVAEIAAAGPIGVDAFMTRCLHDPQDGYYATRPAIGEAGDFITAPLVSQMFGELIGLWLVETWRGLGSPGRFVLCEAGPGDGTLLSDVLRAARLEPAFLTAGEVWLIETSPALLEAQAARLADARPRWAASLYALPSDAPLLLIANEFLDCLPALQFVRTGTGWAERLVGVDETGALAFGLRPVSLPLPRTAPAGAVFEVSPAQETFVRELATRIASQGGGALLIDYGPAEPGFGDTLQALRRRQKVDPLETPGEADLTMHAGFPALLTAARALDVSAALLTQGDFLRRLGVEARAAALARARPDRADRIDRQLHRLVGSSEMGELFKAMAIWSGPTPPAFEGLGGTLR
jgi:SAM-dependent MidA family methyltransferase